MPGRLSANHTHLYPGALLRSLDALDASSRGEDAQVEFSDGVSVAGRWSAAAVDAFVLRLSSYRTGRGTGIGAKAWCLVPTQDPGTFRVKERLPAE